MKTSSPGTAGELDAAAPIVTLAGDASNLAPGRTGAGVDDALERLAQARSFAAPLLTGRRFDTGEDAFEHAHGVALLMAQVGAAPSMQAAAYLVYAGDYLSDPDGTIEQTFGPAYAGLVSHTRKLVQAQRNARDALSDETNREVLALQLERVRKMLLAFSRDLRVVLLRLASRLQTLRWYARSKTPCPRALARETQQVFAPLANRLGIWQFKWELEDLAFRFLEPAQYKRVAQLLDETRLAREQGVETSRLALLQVLQRAGVRATVQGRPKHLYSIWKKMQGKGLDISRVFDVRALRVIVDDVPACYAALSLVHERWHALPEEFDDYIARPKPNGYQSLHTVVRDDEGRPLEIQIRTQSMHEHADSGIAAHWAYKEAGSKGYAGVSAAGDYEERIAVARRAVLNQLLAWERDIAGSSEAVTAHAEQGLFEGRIYVFTPQSSLIELPAGATPVDFAYAVHTELGHRCRGAKVDGAMVPLNTPLQSGQTVAIVTTKEGGPSLDWLNPQLGYLQSARSKAKVRAWFNAKALQETIARGREAVERLLQREGRTAVKLDDLAAQLGFRGASALFEVVGKDEYSLRNIEAVLRPPSDEPADDTPALLKRAKGAGPAAAPKGGVLVVGVESLLTQLARCCRPAPPDDITGYVTRGKGVAVHRSDCGSLRQLRARHPERLIPVAWGDARDGKGGPLVYPVTIGVLAQDRQALLRDISEVFAKDGMNVVGVQTQSAKGLAQMTFTVEVADARRLQGVTGHLMQVPGVVSAQRR